MGAKLKRLNIACGNKYVSSDDNTEWVNLDIDDKDTYGEKIKVDIKWDLEKFPYPFKDNTFDEIRAWAIIEHISDDKRFIKELTRITKENGIIDIIVPHFSHANAFRDPTHKHYYSYESISFPQLNNGNRVIYKKLRVSYNPIINILSPVINLFPKIYDSLFSGMIKCQEIHWKLQVLKKDKIDIIQN
ncbi:MAG: class I SAM-dependent methyltransferase [Nanoarchaeota archaeon]|nr:class I SAM-dependent methyltransferase [Nanoarchaeota archaeon]